MTDPKTPSVSQADKARIQSTQAQAGKDTGAGSFAARAQSAADKATAASAGQTPPTSGTPKKK